MAVGQGPHDFIAQECKSIGARLVTIKNQEDNDAISDFAKKSDCYTYWIGVSCFSLNGNTTCYNDDYSGPIIYNNWAPNHPRKLTDKYKFSLSVYAESGWNFALPWKTVDGSSIAYQGICEVPTTFADPSCKYNYNGYCYIPSHEIPGVTTNSTTYPKAQAICRSLNANMVSIHSKLENDYIKSIYKDSGVSQITLGAQAFQPHVFNWVDGSSFDYSYRDPFDTFTGNCLQMYTIRGLWEEINCQVFNYFLCQKKIGDKSENVRLDESKTNLVVPSDLSDSSGCNNAIVLAPGTVTSFGYGTSPLPVVDCLWRVAALGGDQVSIYFTEMEIGDWLFVELKPNVPVRRYNGTMTGFHYVAPGSTAMIVHSSDSDANMKGFKGVIMPY
ncbi:hypothetical protein B9Z55_008116 [Caenorhabditis nigoni]|nr:hypothetical protein B9Z55_008116 [Caenorhabditis nigoni]